MPDPCSRSIIFTIPGLSCSPGTYGSPDVKVTAVEDNGSIIFTLDVVASAKLTGDLRGLFFNLNDDSKLAGLSYSGSQITKMATGNVSTLNLGASMQNIAPPFDVGLEIGTIGIWKDDIQTTTFTLSNAAHNLTLDDIAHTRFGATVGNVGLPGSWVRMMSPFGMGTTTIAPAAPDANDDSYHLFEDGQAGLNSPSHTPEGTVFQVLANDTDADGDKLTITRIKGVDHGTAVIVDGDDADLLPGDAIQYTPDVDYSGKDVFTYCISDNNGGTDSAEVTVKITAVADIPDLKYQIIAGATVNQIIVRVTATQTDADSSEYIDRVELSGIPAGVGVSEQTYNPAGKPDQIVRDFTLTLPLETDTEFDLGIKAVSKEVSNGDEESAATSVHVEMDYTINEYQKHFDAIDQSMWDTGDEFTFTDDRFLGIDTSWNESGGGFFYGATSGHLKAGFQSTLTFEGGGIDAELDYDIDIATTYNKTTDVLLIDPDALLTSGHFTSDGPDGSYLLEFLFDFYAELSAGVDFGDVIGSYDLFNWRIGPWDTEFTILDLDSSDLSVQIPLPAGFSLTFEWPNIDTSSTGGSSGTYTSSGSSNNFLELGLDVDDLIFTLLGIPNPFDIGFDIDVVWGSVEVADLDLSAGLNFLQEFEMMVNSLPGVLTFENGATQALTFGNDITLTDASGYDADNDGIIEFSLSLDPDVSLNNDTDLGFNVGYQFEALKASGGYDVVVDSGSWSIGPVYSVGDTVPVTTVGVYDETFLLDFQAEGLSFAA